MDKSKNHYDVQTDNKIFKDELGTPPKDQSLNKYSKRAINIVNQHHINGNIPNVQENAYSKPYSVDLRPNSRSRYKSSQKISTKKSSKTIPKSLVLALAAGFAIGAITVTTLDIMRSKAETQLNTTTEQTLDNTTEHSSSSDLDSSLIQNADLTLENDGVSVLQTEVASILDRYSKNPDSVSQQEIENALNNCSSITRQTLLTKVADAYNNRNDVTTKISANDLIYKNGNGKNNTNPYYIATRTRTPSGVYVDTLIADNAKLSSYISTQEKISNMLDDVSNNSNAFNKKDAINLLKKGMNENAEINSADFNYSNNMFGQYKLNINIEKDIDEDR